MNYFRRATITYSVIFIFALMVLAPVSEVQAFSLNDLVKVGNSTQMNSLLDMIGSLLLGKEKWEILRNYRNWTQEDLDKKADDEKYSQNNIQIPQPSSPKKEFVGFYAEWWGNDVSSYTSLIKNADIISTIAPFWATLDGEGQIKDRGGNDHASVVKFAKEKNIQVLLLINNAKADGPNPPISRVLSNSYLRTKAINNIEKYLEKYNLDGVNIDFEMVPAKERDNLTLFMQELYSRFKEKGYVVSIDVFPKQNENIDVSIAYDYEKLAAYSDKIMIMTYDNHAAWNDAGPIADIKWVEDNLKYALKFIPKEKLYLGIAAYGYDWSYGKSGKKVESLEYKDVMELSKKYNSPVKWDELSKSPYFAYTAPDGVQHSVWFENSASLKPKIDLATKYDIAGVAMWKLGEEDPEYWKVMKDVFKKDV